MLDQSYNLNCCLAVLLFWIYVCSKILFFWILALCFLTIDDTSIPISFLLHNHHFSKFCTRFDYWDIKLSAINHEIYFWFVIMMFYQYTIFCPSGSTSQFTKGKSGYLQKWLRYLKMLLVVAVLSLHVLNFQAVVIFLVYLLILSFHTYLINHMKHYH